MRLTKRRARIIRSAILYSREQAGPDGLRAIVLAENLQDLWGRAYDPARYARPPRQRPSNLAERLRQIAESQRMDFDSPNVALTLEEAADALERKCGSAGND